MSQMPAPPKTKLVLRRPTLTTLALGLSIYGGLAALYWLR